MAFNAAQQAAINRARASVGITVDDSDLDGLSDAQKEAVKRARARAANLQTAPPSEPEEPGFYRDTADVATGVLSAVPKAAGALVGLGTYVPGLNKIVDPVAEGLYAAGDFIDERLMSDFQLSKKAELSATLNDSLKDMPAFPEDASMGDRVAFVRDYIMNQGGAAAGYLSENPGQVINFIGETLPHIFLGGVIGKGAKATAIGAQGLTTAGSLASKATGLAANRSAATFGAVGEGVLAAGDIGAQTAIEQRAQGDYDYKPERLYGLLAAPVTALIGRGGAKLSGGDFDTMAVGGALDLVGEGAKKVGLGAAAKTVAKSTASETGEEFLQSGSEQVFGNAAQEKDLYEGVGSSAVIGAATGAGLGTLAGSRQAYKDSQSETTLDPEAASAQTAEELALQAEAQDDADRAAAIEAEEAEIVLQRGVRNVDAFVDVDNYIKARKTQRIDKLNDTTSELHQEYRGWRLETYGLVKTDSAADKKYRKEFLKETAGDPAVETEALRQEHEQALNVFGLEREAANPPAPETVDPINIATTDKRRKVPTGSEQLGLSASAESIILPPSEATAAIEQQVVGELPSPLVMDEQGEMQAGSSSQPAQIPQLSPEITNAVEAARLKEAGGTKPVPKLAPVATPVADPAAMKVSSRRVATAKVDALAAAKALPDDWSSVFPELDSALNAAQFKIKPFEDALEAAVNPQAVPEVGPDGMTPQGTYRSSYDTTERNNDKAPVNTLEESGTTEEAAQSLKDPKALKLSVAQAKIFKVLEDHFTGDKKYAIDEVYAGGEFLDTNIAKFAGVKNRQHVATSIDRFKTKFLETQGLLKPRASQPKKDAAVAAYSERLRQEADEAKQAKIKDSQEAATAEDAVDADISQTADTADTVDIDPNSAGNLGDVSDDGEGSASIFAEGGIDSTVASVGQNNYSNTSATNTDNEITKNDSQGNQLVKSGTISEQAYKAANEQERKAVKERNKLGRQQAKEAGTEFTPEKFKPIKDITAAQIKKFAQKQTTSAEEVAAQAAEQNAKNLQRNINYALQKVSMKTVVTEWNALKSDDTPAITKISKQDVYDWMMSVLEYQESDQSPKNLKQLNEDLREIEQRLEETANDAQPTESDQGSATQSAERTDEARAPPKGSQGQGSAVNSEAGADTSQDGETASDQGAAKTDPVVEKKQDNNLFKRTSRQRAADNTFVSTDQDPMYTGFSTVDEGLDYIIETGNKFENQLARRIKQLAALGDYRFGIVDPDYVLAGQRGLLGWNSRTTLKPKDFEPSDPRLTGRERKAHGKRNYKSAMDIWAEAKPPAGLHHQIGAGDRDSANSVIMLSAQTGLDNNTFLHEMMHGVTAQAVNRVYSGDITRGPIYDLVTELDDIVVGVNKESKKTTASALAKRLGIEPQRAKWIKEVTEEGVGVSVHELVAYAFTDGDFQIYLDSIDMGNNAAPVSAWSKFVDSIRSFMGFQFGESQSNETALERVLALTDKLLDERVAMKTSQVAQRRGVAPNVNATMNPKLKRGEPGVSIDRTPGREAVRSVFGRAGPKAGEVAVEAYDTMSGFMSNPIQQLTYLPEYVKNLSAKMPAATKFLEAVKKGEASITEMNRNTQDIGSRFQLLDPERRVAVNDFIGLSTLYSKWGYDPKAFHPDLFAKKTVKIDSIMGPSFRRLEPAEQKIVADIFAQGESRRQRKAAFAKALGLKNDFFVHQSDGPYAPLKRFGSWVAILRSGELLAAETALNADPKNSAKSKKVEKLKTDGSHYVVQYFDTKGNANKFAEKNQVDNGGEYARNNVLPRGDKYDNNSPSIEVLQSLLGKLKADNDSGMDNSTKKIFADMVREHYFEALDARDARTSGARRLNRAGYEKDMVRSFIFHANAEARLIATMENGAAINESLAEAKEQSREDTGELGIAYDLLSQHYQNLMRSDSGILQPIQDRVAGFNTFMMLTTNPGYYAQNATQILIAVNKLFGDFGRYDQAWSQVFKAYKAARKGVKGSFVKQAGTVLSIGMKDFNNGVEIDLEAFSAEYRPLLQEMQDQQLADVGLQEDLNNIGRFDTGSKQINDLTDQASNVAQRLYQATRFVEAHLRVVTAIAAFEMAKKNPSRLKVLNMDSPMEYAITAVQHTQGSFNGVDAPLLIKKLPKVTTQFRKYPLMMAANYVRAFDQMFRGESAEVKAVGRRTLAVTLTHAALTAGLASGLPVFPQIVYYTTLLLSALFDDDDEYEATKAKGEGGAERFVEQVIRENIQDPDLATLLSRGVPAFLGLDMSSSTGHSNFFKLQPYSDLEITRDGVAQYAFDVVGGPTAGTARNLAGGVEKIAKGDLLKGAELFLPRGARSYLESYRYATEGVTNSMNSTMLDPRSIDTSALLLNALGMKPTEIQELKWTNGQQYELKQYFTARSAKLQNQYLRANANRDRAKMSSLRLEWRELQKAKDRVRPFFNNSMSALKRQPVSDLMSVGRRRMKSERKLQERLGTN